MRDFSWRYFCATGEIDAYLLYKACETLVSYNEVSAASSEGDPEEEE